MKQTLEIMQTDFKSYSGKYLDKFLYYLFKFLYYFSDFMLSIFKNLRIKSGSKMNEYFLKIIEAD